MRKFFRREKDVIIVLATVFFGFAFTLYVRAHDDDKRVIIEPTSKEVALENSTANNGKSLQLESIDRILLMESEPAEETTTVAPTTVAETTVEETTTVEEITTEVVETTVYEEITEEETKAEETTVAFVENVPVPQSELIQVECTAYEPTGQRCADGTWPVEGDTLAGKREWIGRHVNMYFLDGTYIGTFTFHDTGFGHDPDGDGIGSIQDGSRIDYYMNTESECIQWGVKNVLIEFLD